jgi:hypothetical protein
LVVFGVFLVEYGGNDLHAVTKHGIGQNADVGFNLGVEPHIPQRSLIQAGFNAVAGVCAVRLPVVSEATADDELVGQVLLCDFGGLRHLKRKTDQTLLLAFDRL